MSLTKSHAVMTVAIATIIEMKTGTGTESGTDHAVGVLGETENITTMSATGQIGETTTTAVTDEGCCSDFSLFYKASISACNISARSSSAFDSPSASWV